jgi:hypothetical protein
MAPRSADQDEARERAQAVRRLPQVACLRCPPVALPAPVPCCQLQPLFWRARQAGQGVELAGGRGRLQRLSLSCPPALRR